MNCPRCEESFLISSQSITQISGQSSSPNELLQDTQPSDRSPKNSQSGKNRSDDILIAQSSSYSGTNPQTIKNIDRSKSRYFIWGIPIICVLLVIVWQISTVLDKQRGTPLTNNLDSSESQKFESVYSLSYLPSNSDTFLLVQLGALRKYAQENGVTFAQLMAKSGTPEEWFASSDSFLSTSAHTLNLPSIDTLSELLVSLQFQPIGVVTAIVWDHPEEILTRMKKRKYHQVHLEDQRRLLEILDLPLSWYWWQSADQDWIGGINKMDIQAIPNSAEERWNRFVNPLATLHQNVAIKSAKNPFVVLYFHAEKMQDIPQTLQPYLSKYLGNNPLKIDLVNRIFRKIAIQIIPAETPIVLQGQMFDAIVTMDFIQESVASSIEKKVSKSFIDSKKNANFQIDRVKSLLTFRCPCNTSTWKIMINILQNELDNNTSKSISK